MGCRILTGTTDASEAAVFYCSTTMTAFGPVMGSIEEAEKFLEVSFVGSDPRQCSPRELADKYSTFVNSWVCECGQIRDDQCEGCAEGYDTEWNGNKIIHRWSDCYNNEDHVAFCTADPEPKAGERFVCGSCKREKVTA